MSHSISSQASEVEAALQAAWFFLCGENRNFRFVDQESPRSQSKIERCIALTLQMRNTKLQAGIIMLIDRSYAEGVAASMFGIAHDELTEDDITDACAEACNVLSGSLIGFLFDNNQVEIGVPQAVDISSYQMISMTSKLKAIVEGGSDHHSLTLLIFDPIVIDRTEEST